MTDLDLFLKAAGELAAQEAERLWALDVFDPRASDNSQAAQASRAVIEDIITAAGWGWTLPYRGPEPQWCGLTAAACWRAAGHDPTLFASLWASTYRLQLYAKYERFSAKSPPNPPPPPQQPRRLITAVGHGFAPRFTPRRGDIAIVGDGDPSWGDHVTIVTGWDAERMVAETISGNGGGVGPRGNKREGISKRDYAVDPAGGYRLLFVIRPAPTDIVNFSVEKPTG